MDNGSPLDYSAIQAQIEQQLQRDKLQMQRIFFVISLIFYIALMVIGWGLFLNGGGQPPYPNIPGVAHPANPLGDAMTLVTVAGFLPLVFQLTMLVMNTRLGGRQLRDRVTGRIMQREFQKQHEFAAKEKPKRSVHLSDDGELIEDDAEVVQPDAKTAQSGRSNP
ncbi:MAG: hypothetical protein ABI947_16630 [Chloroflexota bacterium]